MAQTLHLDGTFTEETAAGVERTRFLLAQSLSVDRKAVHHETYTANQTDTAIDLAPLTTVTGIIVVVHTAGESVKLKVNGAATEFQVGDVLIVLNTDITALTFSWTKDASDLDLEVVMFG